MTNDRVLVLNKNWVPIDVKSTFDAVNKVFTGRALFIDIETFATYDFESWVMNWQDAIDTARVAEERVVPLVGFKFLLPEVIVCTEYRGFGYKTGHCEPKFSRTNVFRRDRNRCQFCGRKFKSADLTLDHVVPRSRGGGTTWENVVLSCAACNKKKANMTPQEAGMKLMRKPSRPTAGELRRSPIERIMWKVGHIPPKTWEQFLGKMYWTVELQE